MEPINYSLFEYFVNKYPTRTDGNGWEVGCLGGDADEDLYYTEEYIKLISDLRNLFTPYNLSIYDGGACHWLGSKNYVSYSSEFAEHVWMQVGREMTLALMDLGGVFSWCGYSNITPEIFLKDITDILKNHSVKPTRQGELTMGLNSVESVFTKYIEIKTPAHIIRYIKVRHDSDKRNVETRIQLENELKLYRDLKELKSMKELVDKNRVLMEENIKLVEKEDIRKKVSLWLETNSQNINFKIGKGLFDILT